MKMTACAIVHAVKWWHHGAKPCRNCAGNDLEASNQDFNIDILAQESAHAPQLCHVCDDKVKLESSETHDRSVCDQCLHLLVSSLASESTHQQEVGACMEVVSATSQDHHLHALSSMHCNQPSMLACESRLLQSADSS